MSDIYMPEPNMQLVRDVRERREERTQTSDGPLLDELVDALEAAMSKLREAEAIIEKLMDASQRVEGGPIPWVEIDTHDWDAALATYKPTNQEGNTSG